jgi:NFU1 iron-sulfur cluster scaffold homolog, mitochondrial
MKVVSVVTTPNPDALKFTVDQDLLQEGSRSFTSVAGAEKDSLASAIFALTGVTSVFYMANFVTVNKKGDQDWPALEKSIIEVLRAHVVAVKTPEATTGAGGVDESAGPAFKDMSPVQKILAIDRLLDRDIRPGLAGDGGGLEVIGLEDNILQIHYEGACGSCPSSTSGTLMYIESSLRSNLDENLKVVPV